MPESVNRKTEQKERIGNKMSKYFLALVLSMAPVHVDTAESAESLRELYKDLQYSSRVIRDNKWLEIDRETMVPFGYLAFCSNKDKVIQNLCRREDTEDREGTKELFSFRLFKKLKAVNRSVNKHMRYMTDKKQYGHPEVWALNLKKGRHIYGDCEDYALLKQHLLIKYGVPRSSLSIAIGKHPVAGRHAVLLVRTSIGDLILDSITDRIFFTARSPFKITKFQSFDSDGDEYGGWVKPK